MINNRYEILNFLGEGRSNVFLCFDSFSQKKCAIKILSNDVDKKEKELFLNEYFLLKKLKHSNIVDVIDRGIIRKIDYDSLNEKYAYGDLFFTLEYFEGKPLNDLLGHINQQQMLQIIKQISLVLLYLHSSNLVYSDLKFENILYQIKDGSIEIKFIDFGMVASFRKTKHTNIGMGSINYLSPEKIKNEPFNHRSDLYSFGILLYKLVYNQFPTHGTSEIEIFKEHLEREFDFPPTLVNQEIVTAIKKLLKKNPSERYQNILEFCEAIGVNFNVSELLSIIPIVDLIGRDEQLIAIKQWYNDTTATEIISIVGEQGSGKSFLLNKYEEQFPNSLYISSSYSDRNNFHKKIIFDLVYCFYEENNDRNNLIEIADNYVSEKEFKIDDFRKDIIQIIKSTSPLILIDDLFDLPIYQRELMFSLLPTMQLNGAKIIFTKNNSFSDYDGVLKNILELELNNFSDGELYNFVNDSFNEYLPKEKLADLFRKYSDRLPAHLIEFYKELILLEIINVENGRFEITKVKSLLKQLDLSQNEKHKILINNLSEQQLYIISVISCFENSMKKDRLIKLLSTNPDDFESKITELKQKNVLISDSQDTVKFNSQTLKEQIYNNIEDKKALHKKIGYEISKSEFGIDNLETAVQFEKADDHLNAFDYYKSEIEVFHKSSFFNNEKQLLLRCQYLKLSEENLIWINKTLISTLVHLGEFSTCLNHINIVIKQFPALERDVQILEYRAISLLNTGRVSESKVILIELLSETEESLKKNFLYLHLANIEVELDNLDEAKMICTEIYENQFADNEIKGKVSNLLALIAIYSNKMEEAKQLFERALFYYYEANLSHLIAKVKINLGNIYNLQKNFDSAEQCWNDAIKLNLAIGDLDQEAKVLMNYGIFKYEHLQFDEACSLYQRANKIFFTLGNQKGVGQTFYNLAEVYFERCFYEKGFDFANKAVKAAIEIDNTEEYVASLILLALYNYEFEYKSELKKNLSALEKINKQKKVGDKYSVEEKVIKFLITCISNNRINHKLLIDSIDLMIGKDQFNLAAKILFICIDKYYLKRNYEQMIDLLYYTNYKIIFEKNNYCKAARSFYLALLSKNKISTNEMNTIDNLHSALSLIENEAVSKITWQIILQICSFYAYRGNFHKAIIYLNYSKEIFDFILIQFESPALRKDYESSSILKNAFNKIHAITNLIYK